jgi:hypothetical protein
LQVMQQLFLISLLLIFLSQGYIVTLEFKR